MQSKTDDDDKRFQSLLALYNQVNAEIIRYKDREWKNLGLFTASIAAVIAFAFAYRIEIADYWLFFDITLILLASGNIFYTSFVHDRLTVHRNLQDNLQYYFGFHEVQIKGKKLFPKGLPEPTECLRRGWMEGFLSHLLPFFLVDAVLAIFGIWLLHN